MMIGFVRQADGVGAADTNEVRDPLAQSFRTFASHDDARDARERQDIADAVLDDRSSGWPSASIVPQRS
jgi:hypothetical protein